MRTPALALAAIMAVSTPTASYAEDFICGNFEISFDFTAIDALAPILRGEGDMQTIEAALALPSVQTIVRKQQQVHDERSNTEQLRTELIAAQSGETVDNAVYPFPDQDVLADIVLEAARLQADPSTLMEPACNRLSAYLPADYDQDLATIFVIGVNSAGFAFGEPVLHIGFHRMYSDLEGMELVMVHELYHGAQGAYQREPERGAETFSESQGHAFDYLMNGYMEGSATWVGDPAIYEGDGSMLTYFQTRLDRGLNESRSLFTLFEAAVYRLVNDPAADPWELYIAGFTGEERFYNVGYILAREIEAEYGRERLAQAMTQPPTAFFRLYAEIDDPDGPKFSETFLAILSELESAVEAAEALSDAED